MLTVFRRVFPGGSAPPCASLVVTVGTEGETACFEPGRYGSAEEETVRLAAAGLGRSEVEGVRWATPMLE